MCSLVAPEEWCEFIRKVKIRKLQFAWPPTMTQWRVANTLASRLLFFLECHFITPASARRHLPEKT
jgi:hypothetical protein